MADNITLNSGSGGATLATDEISSAHFQRVKLAWGVDGTANMVSGSYPLPVREEPIDGRPAVYVDSNFVSGDSPVTHDVNTDLGRNARYMRLQNTGANSLTFAVTNESAGSPTWTGEITIASGNEQVIQGVAIDRVRITHVGDTSYQLLVY